MGPEKLTTAAANCRDLEHRTAIEGVEEWGYLPDLQKLSLNYENYHAITVLNVTYKVLCQAIFRRLSPIVNRFVGSY